MSYYIKMAPKIRSAVYVSVAISYRRFVGQMPIFKHFWARNMVINKDNPTHKICDLSVIKLTPDCIVLLDILFAVTWITWTAFRVSPTQTVTVGSFKMIWYSSCNHTHYICMFIQSLICYFQTAQSIPYTIYLIQLTTKSIIPPFVHHRKTLIYSKLYTHEQLKTF